ncbi:biotin-dependent carboxyltransferase family protein [Paracoccus tibetensis]|uniref:Allophanate hydrolase subunit 2 n=1 Tax=Paracoccus tibetensis TaxID=336292 RepID=A0A1G5C6Z2_9RHOB|nr:urea amidolyase [Paracoccus tibetensis]SCX98126.1 Allophanate hydrolase subunit 2 [Paracoccus tibetensis]
MSGKLIIHAAQGVLTVQDLGRPGHLAQGLGRGGAMDRLALIEAAALLGQPAPLAAIEMAGAGGTFEVSAPTRIALTGAPMRAQLDGRPLLWAAVHLFRPGQRLRIGPAEAGVYGYLTPAGGIASEAWLGSRAAHLTIGISAPLAAGDAVPLHADPSPQDPALRLDVAPRFAGGELRLIDGPQTPLFSDETLAAFAQARFTRAVQGNRQGIRLDAAARFPAEALRQLTAGLASDIIGPGDVQMTGEGVPYVLGAECQTIGGYPRIGAVLPDDLPRAMQAPPGAGLGFRRITLDEALACHVPEAQLLAEARRRCRPLLRDPREVGDLASHNLIGGVIRGDEHEMEERAR